MRVCVCVCVCVCVADPRCVGVNLVPESDNPEDDKIFLFFKENAMDGEHSGKATIARIGQLCKVTTHALARTHTNTRTHTHAHTHAHTLTHTHARTDTHA